MLNYQRVSIPLKLRFSYFHGYDGDIWDDRVKTCKPSLGMEESSIYMDPHVLVFTKNAWFWPTTKSMNIQRYVFFC
jgi:hypothetical protein